jgi:hypothetical protein
MPWHVLNLKQDANVCIASASLFMSGAMLQAELLCSVQALPKVCHHLCSGTHAFSCSSVTRPAPEHIAGRVRRLHRAYSHRLVLSSWAHLMRQYDSVMLATAKVHNCTAAVLV